MRPWISIAVVAAACGGSPTPKPAPPVALAPTTCADVGVILRGKVDAAAPEAGSAREAAIEQACTGDRWTAELRECIGASRTPEKCLDTLPPTQKTNYDTRLAAWTATYPPAPPADDNASDADDAASTSTECTEVSAAVERLSGDLVVEHDWAVAVRKHRIELACEGDSWHEPAKHCIVSADPAGSDASLAKCIELEGDAAKAAYANAEAALGERAHRIAAAKQKPATIACPKVVTAYYGDAAWKGQLDDVSAAERKKAIAGSRAAMQKTCTADKWDATVRACIIASSGDRECFAGSPVAARAWGFPALEVKLAALPPKCAEYRKALEQYEKCNAGSVDADTMAAVLDMMADEAKQDPKSIDDACAAGIDSIKQMQCP